MMRKQKKRSHARDTRSNEKRELSSLQQAPWRWRSREHLRGPPIALARTHERTRIELDALQEFARADNAHATGAAFKDAAVGSTDEAGRLKLKLSHAAAAARGGSDQDRYIRTFEVARSVFSQRQRQQRGVAESSKPSIRWGTRRWQDAQARRLSRNSELRRFVIMTDENGIAARDEVCAKSHFHSSHTGLGRARAVDEQEDRPALAKLPPPIITFYSTK